MLTRYVEAAMRRARYEILKDDGTYYGEIPGCRGVYANAASSPRHVPAGCPRGDCLPERALCRSKRLTSPVSVPMIRKS